MAAWAITSGLFLAAQWVFALRLRFRPQEIGISTAESVAHAAVGMTVVLLSVGSIAAVLAGLYFVVACLVGFVWDFGSLWRAVGARRRLPAVGLALATVGIAALLWDRPQGAAGAFRLGVVGGVGMLAIWMVLDGPRSSAAMPFKPRWDLSWLAGLAITTLVIGGLAKVDITDALTATVAEVIVVASVIVTLVGAVLLGVLSAGAWPRLGRWIPPPGRPGMTAGGTALLLAAVVGFWTISSAVHDSRVVATGHVPNGVGRLIVGIPLNASRSHGFTNTQRPTSRSRSSFSARTAPRCSTTRSGE